MFAKLVLQLLTEDLDKCFLWNKTIHNHEFKQSGWKKLLKRRPRSGKKSVFQRINRDSLLKLLKGLLGYGVKTHFNVHDSWLVSFGVIRKWSNMVEWQNLPQWISQALIHRLHLVKCLNRKSDTENGGETKIYGDSKPYNEDGFGRCSEKGPKARLTNSIRRRNEPDYQEAVQKLNPFA